MRITATFHAELSHLGFVLEQEMVKYITEHSGSWLARLWPSIHVQELHKGTLLDHLPEDNLMFLKLFQSSLQDIPHAVLALMTLVKKERFDGPKYPV